MLDRTNARLMDLLNNQLARPTGKPGADAFRPLGWMMRGVDTWESNPERALEDLRAHAHQGIVDLYDFLLEQPATFSCSPEEFILGYKPAFEVAVPMEHVASLAAWYHAVGTVFKWLDVPRGDALDAATAERFRKEIGDAVTEAAGVLLPAQEAWSRIRARLG
jgi:hypothetical protein